MKIHLNGDEVDVQDGSTVADLVASTLADPEARGIAVALDDEVATRSEWSSTVVGAGQRVEILRATQGG